MKNAMHKRDTIREFNPKLNFLEQTILDGFRWQEAWALAYEQQKAAAQPLRKRLAALLHFVINRLQVKDVQPHKQGCPDIENPCLERKKSVTVALERGLGFSKGGRNDETLF